NIIEKEEFAYFNSDPVRKEFENLDKNISKYIHSMSQAAEDVDYDDDTTMVDSNDVVDLEKVNAIKKGNGDPFTATSQDLLSSKKTVPSSEAAILSYRQSDNILDWLGKINRQ